MSKAPAKKKNTTDLLDKAANLTRSDKIIVFGIIALVVAGAFYMLIVAPFTTEKNRLIAQQKSAVQGIATQTKKLQNNKAIGNYEESITVAYQYIQQFLPKENEIPRLVQTVSDIGARAGLSDGVTLFALQLPGEVRENYVEIPFTMNLKGEFLTVLKFMYDFSRLNRIIIITKVNISAPKMVDTAREIFHVDVKCGGSIYRALTPDEILAQDKKKP